MYNQNIWYGLIVVYVWGDIKLFICILYNDTIVSRNSSISMRIYTAVTILALFWWVFPKCLATDTLQSVEHNWLITLVWVAFLWHTVSTEKLVNLSNNLHTHSIISNMPRSQLFFFFLYSLEAFPPKCPTKSVFLFGSSLWSELSGLNLFKALIWLFYFLFWSENLFDLLIPTSFEIVLELPPIRLGIPPFPTLIIIRFLSEKTFSLSALDNNP